MRVVDRKKVLPEVTIGLNKEETITLASILRAHGLIRFPKFWNCSVGYNPYWE